MDITTILHEYWLILPILLGGGATWFVMNRRKQTSDEKKIRNGSWEDLLKNQIVVDNFDDKVLAKWITANRAAYTEGRQMLLVHCTENWMIKLGYAANTGIDATKNVIAFIIDMKSGELVCAQLFSFGKIAAKTAERFKGKAELFLNND